MEMTDLPGGLVSNVSRSSVSFVEGWLTDALINFVRTGGNSEAKNWLQRAGISEGLSG